MVTSLAAACASGLVAFQPFASSGAASLHKPSATTSASAASPTPKRLSKIAAAAHALRLHGATVAAPRATPASGVTTGSPQGGSSADTSSAVSPALAKASTQVSGANLLASPAPTAAAPPVVAPLSLIRPALTSTTFSNEIGFFNDGSSPTAAAQTLGISQFPFLMEFSPGSSTTTIAAGVSWVAQYADAYGARLIAPFNMLPDSGVSAAQAVDGAMNQTAINFAQNLVANGQADAVIRIGWEFNGGWFPWGTEAMSPAQFLSIWSQEVDSMKSVPGEHFLFYWNPTVDANNTCSQYLPPAGEVDIVGLDLYDQTNGAWPGAPAAWQSYLTAPCGLDYIASVAASRNLQIGFGEWGLGYNPGANGGDDPYFVTQFVQWCETHPVLFANLWDDGDQFFNGSHPNSVAALKAALAQG